MEVFLHFETLYIFHCCPKFYYLHRYLLLKEPKFIVYNKDQRSSDISQPQIKMQPLQPSSAIPKQKLARPAQAPAGTGNQWLVSPLKDKSKVVAIGRMPPEAGGGGLTAANQVFHHSFTST